MSDVWTIGRLLTWTAGYLGEHGAESPRLDAEVLLAEARGCKRIDLYTAFDEVASEQTRTAFRELVRRRAEGTPVAYLVGRREFYAMTFRVTPDVLIPRPETELVVVTLLDLIKRDAPGRPILVADVGTGSGVLAVCATKHVRQASAVATDISPAALEVARSNARDHGVQDQIEFVESDLLATIPADPKFDFIVSNPPYVSEGEMEGLAREVRDHEPRTALVAGPRGTEVIERLVPQAAERLIAGGSLLIEISPMIADAVGEILAEEPRLEAGPVVKDLAGLARVVQARKK
jgi:release factor glutamine methyltransferase